MIYTIEQIKGICATVFLKRNIKKVFLFGSYSRKEATETSDLDFLIDAEGSNVNNLFDMIDLKEDLKKVFGKDIDLVTLRAINAPSNQKRNPLFRENVMKSCLLVYEEEKKNYECTQEH